ncbi:hypothetical protein T484DRAFT_1853862 [Baffinella frigidus]|nr:hypothetical protein T484DRAFT_1853862 [Cryptophyta sp. CCMP2293]
MIGMYLLYSVLAIYFDNIIPDSMGVRKPPWYFLVPSYWGFGEPTISQKAPTAVEPSDDQDVIAEEELVATRTGQRMAPSSAIEVGQVKGASLAIERNKLLALLGPNGAGKTTLIHMLTGALPPSGLPAQTVTGEAIKRLEQVWLAEESNKLVGTFSGGKSNVG